MSSLRGARVSLIACGSFNPPTYMHLRMFECARSFLEKNYGCTVVEGIISPVSDHFPKAGLLSAEHRLLMTKLAVLNSNWIRVDDWECAQSTWTRTIAVLKHFKMMLTRRNTGSTDTHLMLLCGGDVVDSFTKFTPSGAHLWEPSEVSEIIRDFGLVVIYRQNSQPLATLKKLALAKQLLDNVYIFNDDVLPNDISSTRLRAAIRDGHSIKYCTDDAVIEYISKNSLYKGNDEEMPLDSEDAEKVVPDVLPKQQVPRLAA